MSDLETDIFSELGFSEEESANLVERSKLMIEVVKLIEKNKWTQKTAAELMGVTQPRISDLVRGKIDLFTVDMLINMLARAGEKPVVLTNSQMNNQGVCLVLKMPKQASLVIMQLKPSPTASVRMSHNDYISTSYPRALGTGNYLRSVAA